MFCGKTPWSYKKYEERNIQWQLNPDLKFMFSEYKSFISGLKKKDRAAKLQRKLLPGESYYFVNFSNICGPSNITSLD